MSDERKRRRRPLFGLVFSAALLAALLPLPKAWAGPLAERPNVVLIISDDHDYEHLGFMGNPHVHMPTIDRLAEAGTVFTTAHLPMSRCHPTLASFLSGRWPHQSGIYYNYGTATLDPVDSLPNLLREAGYATYVDGKYWEGDVREMGFTHGRGRNNDFVREGQDDLFAFLDEVAGRRPFFVWYAPRIPHTPHNPPAQYRDLFSRQEIPVPDGFRGDVEAFLEREFLSFAMEAWLDDGIAQMLEKLRQAGVYEQTMLVFVIDNGWCNGLASKGSPFEKGVRTPIFFTWPGRIQAGQRFDVLVHTNDIYPTILDYAGVPVPARAAGRSLRPLIEGRDGSAARDVLYGAVYPAFATPGDERPERDVYALYLRSERWKYVLYLQDVTEDRNRSYFRIQHILTDFPTRRRGDQDLYDLHADPYELENLAADSHHRERLAGFRRQVLDWWRETGGGPLDSPPAR